MYKEFYKTLQLIH